MAVVRQKGLPTHADGIANFYSWNWRVYWIGISVSPIRFCASTDAVVGISVWHLRRECGRMFVYCVLNGVAETRQIIGPELRLFLMIGLLGGFTTFSTFGYETLAMIRDAEVFRAMGNVSLHVFFGLLAVWLGDMLGRVM